MNNNQMLTELLNEVDLLFEDFFTWLAGQHDVESGGFYYAKSSVSNERFKPDIESTAQALNILIRNDLLKEMPVQMQNKMIHFFQFKQNQQTGYFYDENEDMKKDEVMVHRAISYSVGALRKLGNNPLYPLLFRANAAPSYVKSPEAYVKKWDSIDMSNSWRGCDLLANTCFYMLDMPETDREPYITKAIQYLEQIQDPSTGLWGEGSLYVKISGTFKLHTFYNKLNIPMPRTDKIYESILHCLRSEDAVDMCYIRNPINLLSYMKLNIPNNELKEIIEISIKNIKRLKRKDGAFSRELEHSPSAPNVAQIKQGEYYPKMPPPVHLSQGLIEGDMNASTQATLIRLQLYQLCQLNAARLNQQLSFYSYIS
ncbi:hypothetical protein [Chengkuizengella axinellae]|uniref:Squalene cyclase C-terminal domain-containing protein n=1 Tax=Chengkuizengella axinellae TaxID=3064388 RepID=A0ABT9ITG5_9BACL|nr:hypothetical protein [Chengkuizengella sp. 2205SS18-9]MDP5272608.1 hypothetical protein [Chengkuizengella sp. 2205SS18-9]